MEVALCEQHIPLVFEEDGLPVRDVDAVCLAHGSLLSLLVDLKLLLTLLTGW
jgi:hypothetical protein